MTGPKVLILIGSKSDLPVMEETKKTLDEFGVPSKLIIASAHRTPEKVAKLANEAKGNGVKVFIAGAGFAAQLAGAIAARTTLPVIGVPLNASALAGVDSLLSMAQMPSGLPVATMTIGKAGAKNAAILATQILALSDEKLAQKLVDFKKKMTEEVERNDKEI